MSEYWKSTPKYWCKHCGIYVRDTKLERTNHEATGKHQGALQRFLRDLHRGHERELREKDRARREIERLNGVVAGPSSSSSSLPSSSSAPASSNRPSAAAATTRTQTQTREQRQRQWEQLVELGIEVPTELRGEMAMAGDWTVTNTRVVVDDDNGDDKGGERGGGETKKAEALATGVRKRPLNTREDEDREEAAAEEEAAVRGLFKKPRRWGRDTRQAVGDADAELDALLSGTLAVPKKAEEGPGSGYGEKKTKTDPDEEGQAKKEGLGEKEGLPHIKKESGDDRRLEDIAGPDAIGAGDGDRAKEAPAIKREEGEGEGEGAGTGAEPAVPAVVFKKRKPKNIRQK